MKRPELGPARSPAKPQPPSSHEYLEMIIKKAQRKKAFPIRRTFVQGGSATNPRPGPLADFVTKKDPRALDQFLLALTVATSEPHAVTFPAETWARALNIKHFGVVSRAWTRLVNRKLIKRQRTGNRARITLLKEDGSGRAYTHPFQGTKSEPYGQVALEYWLDGIFLKLDLPGKAMLLILSTWSGELSLPAERVPAWYGISADTCERGMLTLLRHGLITKSKDWVKSLHVPGGWAATNVYELQGAFVRPSRRPRILVLPQTGVPF